MPIGPLSFIMTDSHGLNFDDSIFTQPPDLFIEFSFVRGATVNELKVVFFKRLDSVDTINCFTIFVKNTVEINESQNVF